MKSMKQRASERLWNIIAKREIPVPVKAVRSVKKEYSLKEYVSPDDRRKAKAKEGVPLMGLDPPARRTRAKLLQYNRQVGRNLFAEVAAGFEDLAEERQTGAVPIA